MIETKQASIDGIPNGDKYYRKMYEESMKYIDDLTAFGWQKTQTAVQRHGRTSSNYQIFARETTMPNYEQIKDLEDKYETAKNSFKHYERASISTAFLLLLLFILPGVLYIVYKTTKKNAINDNNQRQKEIMEQSVAEARKLLTKIDQ